MNGNGSYWDEDAQAWVQGPAHPGAPPPPPAVPPAPPPQPPPTAPDAAAGGYEAPGYEGLHEAPTAGPSPLPEYAPEYTPGYAPGYDEDPYGGRPGSAATNVVLAVLAVLVIGGIAAIGWWLLRGDGEEQAQPRPTAPRDSAPSQPGESSPREPSPSPTPSASGSVPPAGYVTTVEDGFSFAVPEGWERSADGVSVYFEDPAVEGTFIQVYEVTEETTPYGAVKIIERTKEGATDYRVNDLTDAGDYAEYDYSYTDQDTGQPLRVLLHDFLADDGKMYALLASGPEVDWPQQRELVDRLAETFCTGAACAEG